MNKLILCAVALLLTAYVFPQQPTETPLSLRSDNTKLQPDSSVVYEVRNNNRPIEKYIFTYDQNGNSTQTDFHWRGQQTYWGQTALRWIYDYDDNGNMLLNEYYKSYINGNPDEKIVYEYDNENKLISKISYNLRENPIKKTYQYDEKGIKTYTYFWYCDTGNGMWLPEPTARARYVYDEKNNILQEIHQLYQTETSSWEDRYISDYSHDVYNNTIFTRRSWYADGSWITSSENHLKNTYDAHLNLISVELGYWQEPDSTWLSGELKYIYEYDEYGHRTVTEKRVWNEAKEKWVGTIFYGNGAFDKHGERFDEDGNLLRKEYYWWNNDTDEFYLAYYTTFFYPKSITGMEDINSTDNHIKAYTTNNHLYINTSVPEIISLYSLSGIKLLQMDKCEGEISIPLQNVPNGLFLVKGTSGWVRKLINK